MLNHAWESLEKMNHSSISNKFEQEKSGTHPYIKLIPTFIGGIENMKHSPLRLYPQFKTSKSESAVAQI